MLDLHQRLEGQIPHNNPQCACIIRLVDQKTETLWRELADIKHRHTFAFRYVFQFSFQALVSHSIVLGLLILNSYLSISCWLSLRLAGEIHTEVNQIAEQVKNTDCEECAAEVSNLFDWLSQDVRGSASAIQHHVNTILIFTLFYFIFRIFCFPLAFIFFQFK